MISFIVAMDKNNVIGIKNDNKMPWHLPKDLQFFKEQTTGHTIIMGRKTFDSLGRVLPNRKHIVLTRKDIALQEQVELVHDVSEIVQLAEEHHDEELFIIGGGTIFEQFLDYADKLYVTMIDESFHGDVYFPTISPDEWEEVSREKGEKDAKNPYDYYFIQYIRKD